MSKSGRGFQAMVKTSDLNPGGMGKYWRGLSRKMVCLAAAANRLQFGEDQGQENKLEV